MKARRIEILLSLAGVLVVAALVWHLQSFPEGPQPIVWDQESCSACRMTISDPSFAAQLQTRDGQTLDFDDPGCLLRYVSHAHPEVRAIYFHHYSDARWVPASQVGFVGGPHSPMGYNLAAVDVGTPQSIPFEQALREVGQ